MLAYTDETINAIDFHIARHEPERGGALLGLPNTNVVCRYIHDDHARTTGVSYFPSQELQEIVTVEETKTGLSFKGIVHSHPSGMLRPSGQDHVAFRLGLDINPHLALFLCPIVTRVSALASADNELALESGACLYSYAAYRPRLQQQERRRNRRALNETSIWDLVRPEARGVDADAVEIKQESVAIIPVGRHIEALQKSLNVEFGGEWKKENGFIELNGIHFLTYSFQKRGVEIIAMFPPTYPFSPPAILLTEPRKSGAETVSIPLYWGGPLDSINDQRIRWVDAIIACLSELDGVRDGYE